MSDMAKPLALPAEEGALSLLSLLHLSDFHIADQSHLIPPERIIATFGEVPEKIDAVLVLITGDIAWSGREEEYEIATHFFEKLKKQLKEEVARRNRTSCCSWQSRLFFSLEIPNSGE